MRQKHDALLAALSDESERCDRLCKLNVVEQVANVCQTTIVREAWEHGQELAVHGWIYGLQDGLLCDLNIAATSAQEVDSNYQAAISSIRRPVSARMRGG